MHFGIDVFLECIFVVILMIDREVAIKETCNLMLRWVWHKGINVSWNSKNVLILWQFSFTNFEEEFRFWAQQIVSQMLVVSISSTELTKLSLLLCTKYDKFDLNQSEIFVQIHIWFLHVKRVRMKREGKKRFFYCSQLAKMKKYIPYMSCHKNYSAEAVRISFTNDT